MGMETAEIAAATQNAAFTFLHVGCGMKRKNNTLPIFATDTWREVSLDIDPAVKPDIVDAMPDLANTPSGAFDALFSSHNIEHVFPHEADQAVAAFSRVLKPEGFAIITCPDLQSIGDRIAAGDIESPVYTSPAGPIAPLDILFGHRASLKAGQFYMAHRTGYTARSLFGTCRRGGFTTVYVMREPQRSALWAVAWKVDVPREKAEDFAMGVVFGQTRRAAG